MPGNDRRYGNNDRRGSENYIGSRRREEHYIGEHREHSSNTHSSNTHNSDVHSSNVHSSNVHSSNVHSSNVHSSNTHSSNTHSSNVHSYRSRVASSQSGGAPRPRQPQSQYRDRPAQAQDPRRRAYAQAPERRSAPPRDMRTGSGGGYSSGGRLRRLVFLAVVSAAVIFCLYYIITAVLLSGVNKVRVDTGWSDVPASAVSDISLQHSASVDTILFIGADGSGGEGSRSDTIMYASINKATGKLRLCSVLRDSYVEIPGRRAAKINAAFAYGSDQLCMRTLESNFRVKTRKFVRVNMDSMVMIIDGLGGVDLTLTASEAKAMNSHFGAQVAREGTQTLGGRYALYYARIRKIDDDFHRVSRQRTLLAAIAAKCRKASPITLCSLLNKAAPYVSTNMSSAELSGLGLKILTGLSKSGGPEQMTVPVDGTWTYKQIDGQSCISMDVRTNSEEMCDFLLFRD